MKIRRIRAVVLMVAVLICLIGTVPVRAETVDGQEYDYVFTNRISGTSYQLYNVDFTALPSAYKPVLVRCNDTLALYFISHEPFSYDLSHLQYRSDDNSYVRYNMMHRSGVVYEVINSNGDKVHFYISSFSVEYSFWDLTSGSYVGFYDMGVNNPDISNMPQVLYNIYTGQTDIPGYTENVPDFSDDLSSYDADLGFLQNVTYKVGAVTSKGEVVPRQYANFNWNTTTSTGVDLTDPGIDVQFMIKVQGYGQAWDGKKYNLETKSTDYMMLSDYSNNSYSLSMAFGAEDDSISLENLNPYALLLAQVGSSGPTVSRTQTLVSTFYFRPVTYNDGWQYGGWTRVTTNYNAGDPTLNYDYDVTEGITEDGRPIIKDNLFGDDDGLIPDNSHSGSGSVGNGSSLDEALNNATSGDGSGLSGDLISNVKSMLSMIAEVPAILGSLFSFLPGWCLTLLAVGFGLIVVLIVYKLVRG